MAKQERTRKSAPQNKVKSYKSAQTVIEPWVELNDAERRIFDGYLGSREVETWSDADIEALTKLAKVAVEMDVCWADIQREGRTIFTEKGWPAANPQLSVYSQLSGIYTKQRTALGLTASQRGISGNKQAGRNQQDAKAKKTVKGSADKISSLLARPS